MYPRIVIDVEKYRHNVRVMKERLATHGMSMMAVTKVFCANEELIKILNEEKVDYIADSRVKNLKTMNTSIPKVLLRLPSLHEVHDVVRYADVSLNSEWQTIKALNAAAKAAGKTHKVVVMVDLGDLREGVYYKDDVQSFLQKVETLKHIELHGLGTNLTCHGGIIPREDTLEKLVKIVKTAEKNLGRKLSMVSAGNSSHLHLFENGTDMPTLNNLRIGEAMVLGRETAFGNKVDGLYDDVFTLEADIIELKEKPSYPEGEIGMDAFGKKPSFEDKGPMLRAILAIGKQDVDHHELIPIDQNIEAIGSSSDHVIVNMTNTDKSYAVGDTLTFKLTYGSLLSLMTSPYVVKHYA